MKKVNLVIGILLLSLNVFSQGWIGNSATNSLNPVNASLGLTPMSIGIGTNTPTEQLHTTAGVRFQGITQSDSLTRILAQNNDGKLFWRNALTLIAPPNNNFWSLTGNAATNPVSNFVGTTDLQRLVFKTNNTERVTIGTNGYVGIGTQAPIYPLDIASNAVDQSVRVAGPTPSIVFNERTNTATNFSVGRIGIAGYANALSAGSKFGDFVIQNIGNITDGRSSDLVLGAGRNAANNNGFEIMRLTQITPNKGRVGIGTNTPTATLHTVDSVRFEKLPSGRGTYLVIDAQGYVWKSTLSPESIMQKNNKDDIEALKREIDDLKTQVKALLETKNFVTSSIENVNKNTLEIIPTPFSDNIKAVYSIENFGGNANLQVLDANGSLLKTLPIYQAKGQIELSNIKMTGGMVIFNIISNGRNIISKKSIKM